MNSQPLVSVLIRTRDRKNLLQEALDSVLAQSWSPIEVIIVNDGGEDYSKELPAQDTVSIRWLNNTGSHGRSHAANMALGEATGKYCMFLDDDDTIDPSHIADLVTALEQHDDFHLAYSAVRTMENGVAEVEPSFAHPFDPIRLMIENYIPIHAVLFERETVVGNCSFDPQFDRFEDWDFWLQAAQTQQFLFVDKCTATYRIDTDSGFGAKSNHDDDIDAWRLALYKKWVPIWPGEKLLELLNRGREFPRIAVMEQSISELSEQRDKGTRHIGELNTLVKEKDETIITQQESLEKMDKDLQSSNKALQETAQELKESESELGQQLNRNRALNDELQVIYNSKSWKLTRPLRFLTKLRYHLKQEGLGGLVGRFKIRMEARLNRIKPIKAGSPVSKETTPLSFPVFDNPDSSIVIPVFNKVEYTFHCLKSILDQRGDESFEVIVVDDCSTDDTQKMLEKIDGITVIRNEENLGFINSCNRGAAAAKGKYLVLLNNDTEVREGWLKALRQTFEDHPGAGLVGARLVFADGTLQEAGGIVWRDGSAWNYGRGDDPNKPEYSYLREVDYCSGACLMIPLEEFNALGGFDTHYVPAYYEDTDLAFKVLETGKKVFYQPGATVIHFEGVTSGTDMGSGAKQYQVTNHKKFFERWEKVLEKHRPNGRLPHVEKERRITKRLLVIDARVLMPDHDSGSLRMFNIIKILQNLGYKVTFLPANLQFHEKYTPQLQAAGIECQYLPYVSGVGRYLEDYGQNFDAVIISRADYAEKYLDKVKQCCPAAWVIFDTVDLHFLREQREAELTNDSALRESAAIRKTQELSLARKADTTLVVSPVEMELFRKEAPDINVSLLSNIHRTYETENDFNNRKDILFIGGFEHPPNTDAMIWFLDEIFPLVAKGNPGINLLIVGGHVPASLKSRAGENIRIMGFVSDIQPLFDDIKLSIAPLRYGAGVKGKINSSMSFGVPVVATSIAAEGMNLVHGKDVLIADEPEEFAKEILRLYEDADLWQSLSEAGKKNIDDNFSFTLAEKQLRAVLPA